MNNIFDLKLLIGSRQVHWRRDRSVGDATWQVSSTERRLDSEPTAHSNNSILKVNGIRVEHADREPTIGEDGIPLLLAQSNAVLRLFGTGINNDTRVTFTTRPGAKHVRCEFPIEEEYLVIPDTVTEYSSSVRIKVPAVHPLGSPYYICVKDGSLSGPQFYIHQVSE